MSYTTEEYWKSKTDKELYQIVTGRVSASYNEKLWAQKILNERNFDFDNIDKYKDKWELEKLTKEIIEENTGLRSWFNHPAKDLLHGLGGIFISIVLVVLIVQRLINNEIIDRFEFVAMVVMFTITLISSIFSIRKFIRHKPKRDARLKRIDEITRKLTE